MGHPGASSMLVFYATVLALEDALDIELPDVRVDLSDHELKLRLPDGKYTPPDP